MNQPRMPLLAAEIAELLPHRYPFLFVDRLIECDGDTHAKAIKNVTMNEPWVPGHFPGNPVMPGVLITEAMAQTVGLLLRLGAREGGSGGTPYLAKTDVKFMKPVRPGDTLLLEARKVARTATLAQMHCRATVDGELVAEGRISVTIS